MNAHLAEYVASPGYPDDLAVVGALWSPPETTGIAGAFIFLTYLTAPVLVAVRSGIGATARSVLDGDRERDFLARVIGLADSGPWAGGIANRRVWCSVVALGERHRRFSGMRTTYMDFIAGLIALAPLRVRATAGIGVSAADRASYWRYMSAALAPLIATMPGERATQQRCRRFVDRHAGWSADGERLFASFNGSHPGYVRAAVPALFDGSREALPGRGAYG